jgi:hypothetical protein
VLRQCGFLAVLTVCASGAFAQTRETEPNNSPATANAATLGGKVTGTLRNMGGGGDPEEDLADWWVLSVSAGQTIYVDVDANEFRSGMDPGVYLYAADGVTELARNGNWDGFDSYLTYVAPASGSYYVKIDSELGPYFAQPYTINFTPTQCPTTDENEPNDTPGQAQAIALGASIRGVVCPMSDGGLGNVDYFRLSVPAGTKFRVQVDTVGRERPSLGCACELYTYMTLYASDGTTALGSINSEHQFPYRIEYQATSGGTYYVAVNRWPSGIRYGYTLRTTSLSTGKGDPVTARADGLGNPWAVIGDPFGDFIVSDENGNQVWWVTTSGRKQVITREVQSPSALGWDVFANLLIVGRAGVYKLNPKGQVSQLIAGEGFHGVALGTDGTLWLTTSNPPALRHYDPFGSLLETIPLNVAGFGEAGPYEIAVSAAGDVYFATDIVNTPDPGGTSVYRLVGKQGQRVFQAGVNATGLAIDASGNFYISSGVDNRVSRYSPTGVALDDPLSGQLSTPVGIAFGRNTDGSMNSRLFVVERGGGGRFVELNSAGVPQRGAPVGFATANQAIADLLKPGALGDAQRRVLDAVGNKNGRYDVGDLRAFLIQTTTLSAVSPFAAAGGKP